MGKCLVNLKVRAIFGVEIDADSLEDAIEKGGNFKWSDLVGVNAFDVSVDEGVCMVIGVSDLDEWDIDADTEKKGGE